MKKFGASANAPLRGGARNGTCARPRVEIGSHQGRTQRLAVGDVLYRQGEPIVAIYRVREGLIKLLTYLPTGEARILRLKRPESWLGLGGFLDRPYHYTAVAVTESVVDRFPMGELTHMSEEEPRTLNRLMTQWYVDLDEADTWIAKFSTGSIKLRVAHLLKYLAELEAGKQGLVHLLTVQEMGEILGVTPESVSRTIAAFKRARILRRLPGRARDAYLIDVRKLEQEVRGR